MRKYSLMLLMVVLVLAVGLAAVACGSSASSQDPQQLLTKALSAGKAATSGSGTFEIDLTVKADTSQTATTSSEDITAALLGQPIKITGTFASQDNPVRADLTAALSLSGINLQAGVRAVDDKAWLNLLGTWYEVPAEALQQSGGASSADLTKTARQIMDEQGIDVSKWVTDLKSAGDETLTDKTAVTHLTGTVDVQKMLTDVVALTQNPKFQALMATESSAAGTATTDTIPDAATMQAEMAAIQQMFKTATVDLWVAKSGGSLRKAALNMDIAIPAEMGLSGISGATVVATINLDAAGKAVDVTAPGSSKPFTDLQKDLEANPIFSGLSGLIGSGSGGLGSLLGGGETPTT